MIPVGFYRPDLAQTNPGVAGTVVNAILQKDTLGVAYGPQPGAAILSAATALPSDPRGIFSFITSDGSYKVIGGTETNLYLMSTLGVWTSIGSGYTLPAGHNWSAAQFENYAIFTNTFDGQVQYDLDGAGTFSAIVGAPKARSIFPLFGTLAALDCDGDNRVIRTSKAGDHTVWTGPGANFQTVTDGGELLAGGEITTGVALVAQRNGWQILTRRPDKYVFNRDKLTGDVGALNPEAVVFTNGAAITVDTFGFHRVTPGGTENISEAKVSRTFLDSLASNGANTVQGVYDPQYGRVLYRYQHEDASSETVFDDILAYHLTFGEFVPLEITTTALVSLATPAYTLEDLDSISASIETLPYSLDSAFYKGGRPRLGILNGDRKFGFLSGDNLAATVECGIQSSPVSLLINSIVPDTDCDNATVQCGAKNRISGDLEWGDAAGIEEDGRSMLRSRGKYYAFRFNSAAGELWTFVRGFTDLDASPGGVS